MALVHELETRLALLALTACAGCVGDVVELTVGERDLSAAVIDMGSPDQEPPTPPKFFPDIQADLDKAAPIACTNMICHGGTTDPILLPMPATPADQMANYMNFVNVANMGPDSPALTVNLPGGTHTGGARFTMGTSDPTYLKWLAWINAGNPQ